MNTELDTLLRCVDDVVREIADVGVGYSSSGQTCRVSVYAAQRLRDARARHLRSTGVPCRLDVASRSVSDDKPIVAAPGYAVGGYPAPRPALGAHLGGGVHDG